MDPGTTCGKLSALPLGSAPVSASWQLCTEDPLERRRFADLASTLHLPGSPAGPRNRLRHVVRIEADGGTWFLKVFTRTQWKNRLHFATSRPFASSDAERELRVTEALRAAGHATPVPVACGRFGPKSYYLCRALEGSSLADLLARGAVPAGLGHAVANHCGRLLHEGFHLPDLSADHVFVAGAAGSWRLAVLDLHNGQFGRSGAAPRRVLVRVLRRFARSVRQLPVSWPQALSFAVRLVRAAGRGAEVRKLLGRLPPFSTAARYEVAGKSHAYATRNPDRDAREQEMLARVWPGRPGESVLDLPCGAGRLLPLLTGRFGHRVVHGDGAVAMLRQARAAAEHPAPSTTADALAMPFADRCVDGVVMFRFLHHLAPELRHQALAEACRTARRFVVVSFFHPCSFHHLQRRLRQLGGGTPTRFAVPLGALRREFLRHGFVLQTTAADLPYARDLWLASFVRA
jgi:SAM-dependent methyltransferase